MKNMKISVRKAEVVGDRTGDFIIEVLYDDVELQKPCLGNPEIYPDPALPPDKTKPLTPVEPAVVVFTEPQIEDHETFRNPQTIDRV